MATIGSLVVKIGTDISGLERGLNTAQGKMRAFGQQMKSVGTGLTLGLTAPIVGIATQAIRSAAAFEQSMNVMRVVTSATESQMASLQAEALRLGRETSFSAGQAAEAMLELGKAGMSTGQIMDSIGGVLDLAAAGNLELARAAEITANTLNMFNLPAKEATNIANLLAAAANASSVDVVDLADSLKMSGAVMAQYNVSLQDTVTALSLMGNAGIKGSDAGTSLKTMMMRLAAPTDAAAATLAAFNIAVYDAQGNMAPMISILRQLDAAFAGVDEATRNAAMAQIFGADAVRAANILVAASGPEWDAMSAAVNKSGAASAAAGANMSGLAGAFKYLSGSVDSFLIGQALPFSAALSGMIRGAADLLTSVGKLPEPTQRFAAAMVGLLAVAGPLLMIVGGMATGMALLISPVGLAAAALVILGAAAVANWGTITSATATAVAAMTPHWETFLGWLERAKGFDFGGMAKGIQQTGAAAALMGGLRVAQLRTQLDVALDAVDFDLTPLTQRITGELNQVKLGVLLALSTGGALVDVAAIQERVRTQVEGLLNGVKVGALLALGTDNVLSRSIATVTGALDSIQATVQGAGSLDAAGRFGAAVDAVLAALGAVGSIKADIITTAVGAITSVATALLNLGTQGIGELDTTRLGEIGVRLVQGYTNAITAAIDADALQGLGDAAGGLVGAFVTKLTELLGQDKFAALMGVAVGGAAAAILEGTMALVAGIATQLGQVDWELFVEELQSFTSTFMSGFAGELAKGDYAPLAQAILTGIGNMLSGLLLGNPLSFLNMGGDFGLTGTKYEGLGQMQDGPPWEEIISPPDWDVLIPDIDWTGIVEGLSWEMFIPPASWSDFIPDITWSSFVPNLSWGSFISGMSWSSFVPNIDWSAFIPKLFGGGGSGAGTGGISGDVPKNALGTSSWRGGWSLVGERGPELAYVPAGARIYNANETRGMMADGGGGVHVTVHVARMDSQLDEEALAYRIAKKIQRRG